MILILIINIKKIKIIIMKIMIKKKFLMKKMIIMIRITIKMMRKK